MKGNFEHPPIVISLISRSRLVTGLVLSLLAVLITKFEPGLPFLAKFLAYGFGYLAVAALLASLLTSPQLTISPDGLLWSTRLSSKSWAWDDFDQFNVMTLPIFGLNMVGCCFSQNYIERTQPVSNPLSAQSGTGAIGMLWEMPVPDLVQLLNEVRQRWSPPAAADYPLISNP